MAKFIIYTQHRCNFCNVAKDLMKEKEWKYEERLLDTPEKLKKFKQSGYKTVPQIFMKVGGYSELKEFTKLWQN